MAIEAAGRLGDDALRSSELNRAIELVRGETSAHLLLQLGDHLLRAERFKEAAHFYTRAIGRIDCDTPYARRLIQARYQAGLFESALEACSQLREVDSSKYVTEMESVIYEGLGNLEKAKAVCEAYIANSPADISVRLRLALICYRLGDTASVQRVLTTVDSAAVVKNIEHTAVYSQLLAEIGREHAALDALFHCRRLHPNDATAHLQYVTRYTTLARSEETVPDKVSADVAVELSGTGAPPCILITTAPNPDRRDDEYGLNDPVAKAILGKVVGDAVGFPGKPGTRWTITRLLSKYAFAFRQGLNALTSRFAAEPGLESYAVPDGPGEFAAQVRDRLMADAPFQEAALREYASGRLTVGALGRVLRRSTIEAVGAAASSAGGLAACTNSLPERDAVFRLLGDGRVLVLESTACTILDELGLLDDTALSEHRFGVTQSTIDEFRVAEAEWNRRDTEGFMSLALEGGNVVRIDVPAEAVATMRARYARILRWLMTRAEPIPVPASLSEKHADYPMGALIGQASWDSVLVASEAGRALLSDDLRGCASSLRDSFASRVRVPPFC